MTLVFILVFCLSIRGRGLGERRSCPGDTLTQGCLQGKCSTDTMSNENVVALEPVLPLEIRDSGEHIVDMVGVFCIAELVVGSLVLILWVG